MHRRAGDRPPYEVFRNDAVFPVERILDAARLVGMGSEHRDPLISLLDDDESCVRYWAVVGLTILGEDARPAIAKLNGLLDDASGPVRVAAAECLCRLGRLETGAGRLLDVFGREDKFQHLEAAVAILLLGEQARPYATEIKTALAKVQLPEKGWQKDITEVLKECLRRLES